MEMSHLRWILLIAAILVIAGVYVFSRARKKNQPTSLLDEADDIPSFSAKEISAKDDWMHGVGPVRVVSNVESIPEVDFVRETESEIEESLSKDALETPQKIPVQTPEKNTQEKNTQEKNTQEKNTQEQSKQKLAESDSEKKYQESIRREHAKKEAASKENPSIKETKEEIFNTEPASMESSSTESTSTESTSTEPSNTEQADAVDDVISVYVLAKVEEKIKGEKILSASYALQLDHGDMKIFHRHSQTPQRKIEFSMANIQQPGWFEIDNMNDMQTSGVSFFMQVNLVDNPSAVLDEMLICAHNLSTMLGAMLCNGQRKILDEASTIELREKVKRLEEIKSQSV